MKPINIEDIKKLGALWKSLNGEYDDTITALIDAEEPTPISPEEMERLKKIQGELFDLEQELYKALQAE